MWRKKRKWTGKTKMWASLSGLVQLGMMGAVLADLRRRSPDTLNGSKRMWSALAFVNYIGPIAYFLMGRKKSALMA